MDKESLYLLTVYLAFVLGFLLHVSKAASRGVQHGVSCSYRDWLTKYAVANVVRGALALTLYALYVNEPALAKTLLAWTGYVPSWSLPASRPVGVLLGYFADSALDLLGKKASWLTRELPSRADEGEAKV